MNRGDPLDAEKNAAETAGRIARLFLPSAGSVTLRRMAAGFSGAAVFACQADEHVFALKRWPAGTSAGRVDEVHEVMTQASRCLALVPKLVCSPLGSTRLGWESYHYELATWMPGEPFGGGASSDHKSSEDAESGIDLPAMLAAVGAGAEAIASFHDSALRWGSACAPAPAVLRRLGRIEQLRTELPLALSRCDSLSPTLRIAADRLRREGLQALESACGSLGRWAAQVVPTQIVLRDVHRGHIFFARGRPSGLIDFDALGRDTVATDLARWISDFFVPGVDRRAIWEAAEAGYSRVRPISTCERGVAVAISQASEMINLANWVVWVALGQRDFSAYMDLVDRRVSELMRRMVPNRITPDAQW